MTTVFFPWKTEDVGFLCPVVLINGWKSKFCCLVGHRDLIFYSTLCKTPFWLEFEFCLLVISLTTVLGLSCRILHEQQLGNQLASSKRFFLILQIHAPFFDRKSNTKDIPTLRALTNVPLNRDHFKRKFLNQPSIFHGIFGSFPGFQGWYKVYKIYKYLESEPQWPLFLKVTPPKSKPFSNQNEGHLGSRYMNIGCQFLKLGIQHQNVFPTPKNRIGGMALSNPLIFSNVEFFGPNQAVSSFLCQVLTLQV